MITIHDDNDYKCWIEDEDYGIVFSEWDRAYGNSKMYIPKNDLAALLRLYLDVLNRDENSVYLFADKYMREVFDNNVRYGNIVEVKIREEE